MASDLNWELYRTFLAVLTEGSLSGAARALGITQPTVGRHIAQLEAAFGQTLFTRSQTGLLPTEAAAALRGFAQTMRTTAAALERAAASQGAALAGVVRISASEVVAVEVLPPILASLRRSAPGLVIELVATNRVQDLLQREVDIAVRMTEPQQDMLIARRVGAIEVGLHARDDYLLAHGTPKTTAALAQHALIGFDRVTPFVRGATKKWPLWRREAFALRADSDLAQLAMIRAGCGIGACQVAIARRDARLVRVLPELRVIDLQTWVTMHEDLRSNPRCKAVFDALVRGLAAYVEGAAG
ncbi:LysR family transcriptional regulator [Paraburkholderia lycopersici]|uniref:DNA-binding transcriptional regulator, LysR family n=1 Tax=Paraburkholderia lycopersici TaxID=416944 RepID=A0A1G6M9F6_9BURK|nr:LysR family transcriptional regulator [Paraburkholderia lycopersici]SDC52090.1 DNA-binding transcriptional regulator, LysR family [Paraburkholderia lycopersici]